MQELHNLTRDIKTFVYTEQLNPEPNFLEMDPNWNKYCF